MRPVRCFIVGIAIAAVTMSGAFFETAIAQERIYVLCNYQKTRSCDCRDGKGTKALFWATISYKSYKPISQVTSQEIETKCNQNGYWGYGWGPYDSMSGIRHHIINGGDWHNEHCRKNCGIEKAYNYSPPD